MVERSQHSGGLASRPRPVGPKAKLGAGRTPCCPSPPCWPKTCAYGVPAERIHVIPNGINRAHFAHAPSPTGGQGSAGPAGRVVLASPASVRDWHGVDRIVDWMASPGAPANTHPLVWWATAPCAPSPGPLPGLAERAYLHRRQPTATRCPPTWPPSTWVPATSPPPPTPRPLKPIWNTWCWQGRHRPGHAQPVVRKCSPTT